MYVPLNRRCPHGLDQYVCITCVKAREYWYNKGLIVKSFTPEPSQSLPPLGEKIPSPSPPPPKDTPTGTPGVLIGPDGKMKTNLPLPWIDNI